MKYPLLFFSVLPTSFRMKGFGKDISDPDGNFRPAAVGEAAVNHFNAFQSSFELTGFPRRREGAPPHHLPPEFPEKEVRPAVLRLALHCCGGDFLFQSESPYLIIRAVYRAFYDMDYMAIGSPGFDLYTSEHVREHFLTTVQLRPRHAIRPLKQCFAISGEIAKSPAPCIWCSATDCRIRESASAPEAVCSLLSRRKSGKPFYSTVRPSPRGHAPPARRTAIPLYSAGH